MIPLYIPLWLICKKCGTMWDPAELYQDKKLVYRCTICDCKWFRVESDEDEE
jgi:predicted  nucleic acid-binding Zn-ribbon protein